MESQTAINRVEDLYAVKNPFTTHAEYAAELRLLGFTIADLESQKNLLFELGIAHNIRLACEALGMLVSPHESLTLAKNMIVGADRYRNGVPLSDRERAIALRLTRIHLQECCRKNGELFTEAVEKDCERMVQFRERGLTVGHKIGEASGCFRIFITILLFLTMFILVSVVSRGTSPPPIATGGRGARSEECGRAAVVNRGRTPEQRIEPN